MSKKDDSVDVRISRRTMWLGEKPYPLQQVSAVRTLEVVPPRGRVIARFGKQAALWVALGIVGLCAGTRLPWPIVLIAELLVFAGLIVTAARMVYQLTRSALYVLSISIAGRSQQVLASRDKDQIFQLRDRIAAAIDDPETSYQAHVRQVSLDDRIGGDKSNGEAYRNGPPGGPEFPTEP